MIPSTNTRTVQLSGAVASGEFGISLEDSAHIMTILRDTLYSDKILAVLREYGANAWDANREAGRGDLPIEVTLPTAMDPTLSIRDHGPGLSREGIFKVYTQYGRSTKRDSDTAVGMLGIGSKSGFAYADSFTITSFHGGTKSVYVAALDASEKGVVNLLHEEPCGEETGVLIQIAVEPHDIHEFQSKASNLFKYFIPRPKINIELPELPKEQSNLKNGVIFHNADWDYRGWVAVMGCVSYRINLDQIMRHEEGLPSFVRDLAGALYFNIGEVHINASREELKYSNSTKRVLIDRFNGLIEEYVRETLDGIEKQNLSPWEKRLRLQNLQKFRLVIPKQYEGMLNNYVQFSGKPPSTFRFYQKRDATDSMSIAQDTRILIRDENRSLKGYDLGYHDYILRREWRNAPDLNAPNRAPHPTWDEVEKELAQFLADKDLTGIKIQKMSELPWTPPEKIPGAVNIKHKLKLFQWGGRTEDFKPPYSKFWDPVEREAEDEDVYVEIESFKVNDGLNMMECWKEDLQLAKAFGKTLPTVYAYKVREKDAPVERQGIHYREWREKFHAELIKDAEFLKQYEVWRYKDLFHDEYYSYRRHDRASISRLEGLLGKDHIICQFLRSKDENTRAADKQSFSEGIIRLLAEKFPKELDRKKCQAQQQLDVINELYPLFSIPDVSLSVLKGDHHQKWVQYIQTLDKGTNP